MVHYTKQVLPGPVLQYVLISGIMGKRILFFTLISLLFINVLWTDEEPRIITRNWVKSQFIQRDARFTMATPNEISRFDTDVLVYLGKNDFSRVEPLVAKLIFEIMTNKPYYGYHNIRLGFILLAGKFKDKMFFFDQVANVTEFDFMRDPIVIISVIGELEKNIEKDTDRVFKGFLQLLKVIDPYMAVKHNPDSQRIATAMISFIRTYMKLIEHEKLKDSKQDIITLLYKKMDFNKRESLFDGLPGSEDVREEYFFYIDGGF